MRTHFSAGLWMLLLSLLPAGDLRAQDDEYPYLNQLKQELNTGETGSSDSYTQKLLKKMDEESGKSPPAEESYSESIRKNELSPKVSSPSNYSEQEKLKIPPKEEGGAIQALHEGRSELKGEKSGFIRNAIGFRYSDGGLMSRNFSAAGQNRPYSDVYGSSYSPDLSVFYEYQPFHSELYGNIGFFGMGGMGYGSGTGAFARSLKKPGGAATDTFPLESKTQFQFYTIPVAVGLSYRFNLMRILRPYIWLGPAMMGYIENRSDDQKGTRGFSRGFVVSSGVALMLDWILPGTSWDLYSELGVKHYYLTFDYTRFVSVGSDVLLSSSGFYAGFMYEF